jgi:multidrug efflux pump subunit AcrA (membrane-fusion protein)
MQIPQKQTRRITIKSLIFFLTIITIGSLLFWFPSKAKVPVLTDNVVQGKMLQTIPIFGLLRAKNEQSIIPRVNGTVAEKLVRPGDRVLSQSPIFRLSNVKIEQALISAQLDLMSASANVKELKSELVRQQRRLTNQQALTKSKLALAKAELDANKQLAEKHIISTIDLLQAEISSQQAQLEWQMAKDELLDFTELRQAREDVIMAKLKQAEAKLRIASSNQDGLEIKSGMTGIIQSLDKNIKIGQWLNAGQSLGSIAQDDNLYAEGKVMASYAVLLNIGQSVELNIKGEIATGNISHIEPNVVDNQVQVLIELAELPSTARLNIEVTGQIAVIDKSALIVSKPDYITRPHTETTVWRKNAKNDEFQEHKIQLGDITKDQIEIISGLTVGDIISLERL